MIIGSSSKNFAAAFSGKDSDGTLLKFTAVQNELPVVMVDEENNKWDIFGNVVEGPRAGESLEQEKAFVAYWFAWAAFYPNAIIYE